MRGRFGLGFKRKKLDSATIAALDSIFTQAAGGNVAKVRTTRSTLATCIGPDGTLQWGPHNLLTESGYFNNSYWAKLTVGSGTAPVCTDNFAVAPDGTQTASRVQFNTVGATGGDASYLSGTTVSVVSGLAQVWAKSNDGRSQVIRIRGGANTGAAKTITSTWALIWDANSGAGDRFQLLKYGNDDANTTADILFWHPQLENVTGTNRTTPSDYVDSTVKNRLGYSNDFANAAWSKTTMGVQANSCAGPTGQPAHTLTAGATNSEIWQSLALAGVYAAGFLIRRRLGSGAISLRNSANSAWLPQPITTDWAFYQNDGGTSGGNAYCDLLMATEGDQIDICDARLAPGTSAANYFYNPGSAPAVGPIYGQRTDYDPVTLACKGALIEPTQVTQLLANPDDLSNATNWAGNVTATDDGTRFRGRRMWKLAKTTTSTGEARYQYFGTAQSGHVTQKFVFQASSNSSQAAFGLYCDSSGWGANANTTSYIESGPGTLTQQNGGLWSITGLATNVPTVVITTRNRLVSEAFYVNLYPDINTSTTIGKAIYAQVDNLVAGTDGGGSFIPNPATSGTVVRVADTSSVGYDDLAKALPWLMDSNMLPPHKVENFDAWDKGGSGTGIAPVVTPNDTTYAAPDGTMTASKVVFNVGGGTTVSDYSLLASGPVSGATAGAPYSGKFRVMGAAGTQIMFRHAAGSAYAFVTCSGLGIWDDIPGRVEIALSSTIDMTIVLRQGYGQTVNSTATVWLWGAKLNPGPVAQVYYPQSSKAATIAVEADLTYGAASGGMALVSLENTSANRVEIYKQTAGSLLYGYVNANSATPGSITSGGVFKPVVGFSLSSAGTVLNGSAESAITASAFAAAPNILKIGNDAAGNAASSMHLRRLRIFSQNLPASTKQALTR